MLFNSIKEIINKLKKEIQAESKMENPAHSFRETNLVFQLI